MLEGSGFELSVPGQSKFVSHGFPFEFRGLVGIADLLRPTVPAGGGERRTAGVGVIMIIGDYPQASSETPDHLHNRE
jgi:hypothetical protein